MDRKRFAMCLIVVAGTAFGCSPSTGADTGTGNDAAVIDTGGGGNDVQTPTDTGGGTDVQTPTDTGGGTFMALAPCNAEGDYATTGTAVAISGFTFSPACLRVAANTMVTIEASSVHPLSASTARGSANNPITSGTAPQTMTFTTPGFYPFYCTVHGTPDGTGMAGVIWVQ